MDQRQHERFLKRTGFSNLDAFRKLFLAVNPVGHNRLFESKAGSFTQAGIELTRAGRLYANDTNTASADGYATLNLKASHVWMLAAGQLTTYARMDNLTDKRYVGSVIVNQAGSQFYEPAPGRNWTLGVRLVMPL